MSETFAAFLSGVLLVGLVSAFGLMYCADTSDRRGRCRELCRPEKFIEVVNYDGECLCATKRVKLERVP